MKDNDDCHCSGGKIVVVRDQGVSEFGNKSKKKWRSNDFPFLFFICGFLSLLVYTFYNKFIVSLFFIRFSYILLSFDSVLFLFSLFHFFLKFPNFYPQDFVKLCGNVFVLHV